MTAEVARNSKLEVQATIDTAKTITAITKANPGVASSTAHGFSNGDVVVLAIEGMTELDGLVVRVANVAANTFELEGIDTTNFGTFTSGTAKEVLTWLTVAEATQVNFGAGQAEQLEKTRLIDRTKRYEAGLPDQPNITVNLFSDVTESAQVAVEGYGRDGIAVAWRYTRKSGKLSYFGGTPSTVGEDNNVGQLVTGSFTITQSSPRLAHYAS
jgi:hypothetical protein